MNLLIHNFS